MSLVPSDRGGRGGEDQGAVPAVVVLDAGGAPLLCLGQDDLLLAIPVQVSGEGAAVGGPHDLRGLAVGDGIPHQGAEGGPHLPADQDVARPGPAQVDVLDGLDLAAHPLDAGVDLVLPLVILLEDHDAQGSVSLRVPEKDHRLLDVVPIHVHQLDGLAVLPAEGGDELPVPLLLVDLGLEVYIGLGGFGQGVHLVHAAKHAAPQPQQTQRQDQAEQHPFCHGAASFPGGRQGRLSRIISSILSYHISAGFPTANLQFATEKLLPRPGSCCIISCDFPRRCDGIGRRSGLKIHRWRQRTGSSPVTGTKPI